MGFVFFKMVNVLHGPSKYGSLCLFTRAIWHDATEFVYSFIYVASSSAFDFFLVSSRIRFEMEVAHKATYVVVFSLSSPLVCPHSSSAISSCPTRTCTGRGYCLEFVGIVGVYVCLVAVLDGWRGHRGCLYGSGGGGRELTEVGWTTRMGRRARVGDAWHALARGM